MIHTRREQVRGLPDAAEPQVTEISGSACITIDCLVHKDDGHMWSIKLFKSSFHKYLFLNFAKGLTTLLGQEESMEERYPILRPAIAPNVHIY